MAVLVGEGPLQGACCMDDYVRAVEPVFDYLTRYSGIQPGGRAGPAAYRT